MQDIELSPAELRLRLNALLRAYIRGDSLVAGKSLSQEQIVTEMRTIKTALESANTPNDPQPDSTGT